MQEDKVLLVPFLPEASIWIRHIQVYYSLLNFHKGKLKNRGNLKRVAQHCNIPDPLSLLILEITMCLKACKKECAFYQEHTASGFVGSTSTTGSELHRSKKTRRHSTRSMQLSKGSSSIISVVS
jgi:hypothetical protein